MDKIKSECKQKERYKRLDDMTTLEFQYGRLDFSKKKDSKALMNNLLSLIFFAILAFAFIRLDSKMQDLIVYIAAGIILFCIDYKVYRYVRDLFVDIALYWWLFGLIYKIRSKI